MLPTQKLLMKNQSDRVYVYNEKRVMILMYHVCQEAETMRVKRTKKKKNALFSFLNI